MPGIDFEGRRVDARTRDMLVAARVVCGPPLVITQGSYNGGGVAASAGTHDGGGALDLRATNHTAAQRREVVNILRKVGFAAWLRTPSQGNWPYHYHAIAKGCPDLSRGARAQVIDYLAGRNGLANNGADDGPRTYVNWTWEKYKATYPDLLTEDQMTPAQMTELKDFIEARTQAYSSFNAKNLTVQLAALESRLDDIVQSENEEYGIRLLADPSGTGTNFMKDTRDGLEALTKALSDLTAKVDALPKA